MKNMIILSILVMITGFFTGCKKEEPDPFAELNLVTGDIHFTDGKVKAPSATILSRGKNYSEMLPVDDNSLVAINLDEKWYFFYTGINDSTCHLSDSLSRISMATFIARSYTKNMKSGKGSSYISELPTGLGVDELIAGEKYKFTNFKIRWAAIDNGENKYYLTPKEMISISFMDWLETGNPLGINVQDSHEVPFVDKQYKTYGTVVRAWAIPVFNFLVDYNNLYEAYSHDPDLLTRINTVELIEILFEAITEITGDVPVVGDCINACVEPIFAIVKGLGYNFLIGQEQAREEFRNAIDVYIVDLVSCLANVLTAGQLEGVREALDLISSLYWAGMAITGAWDAATSKYYCDFVPPGINIVVDGPCDQVNNLYPLGTTLYGQQARGCNGDFSCWSDVYTEHGVRISPWYGSGRAYYDYGPVSQGSITVTFQWVDNAWWSDWKALEVYNWYMSSWEQIARWEGCDGKEHFSSYSIPITAARIGPSQQVRVALWGGSSSVIHLNTITVE